MKLLIIRHAQSAGNIDKNLHKTIADHKIPITDQGCLQAKEAGEFLKKYFDQNYTDFLGNIRKTYIPSVAIWTSPYLRTRQTTENILNSFGSSGLLIKVKESFLLAEQQYGLFDGIPDEDLPNLFPNEYAHYQKQMDQQGRFWARMPLGESRFDVAQRAHQFLNQNLPDVINIIVTHSITARALAMVALNATPEWFDSHDSKKPKNCSIRLIDNNMDKGYIFDGYE